MTKSNTTMSPWDGPTYPGRLRCHQYNQKGILFQGRESGPHAVCCHNTRKAVLTPVCTCVGVHAGQPVTRLPLESRGSGGRGKPQARPCAHIHRMQDSLETPVAAPGGPTSGPPDNWGCSGEAALSPGGGATGQHPQESSLGGL